VTVLIPHRNEFTDRYSIRMKHEFDADRKYMGGTLQYLYMKVLSFVKEKQVGNPEYPTLPR